MNAGTVKPEIGKIIGRRPGRSHPALISKGGSLQLTEQRPALKLAAWSKNSLGGTAEAVRVYQKDAIRVTDRALF
jgi:hypothetical protein